MIATNTILDFFLETRHTTETICKPLEIEDYVVQPIVDVSPPKWHLGHSTWFFEEFILKSFKDNYECFNDSYGFVFNSYYESFGKRVVRTNRGNLSRPTVNDIYKYRHYITKQMELLLQDNDSEELIELVEIGIHHEKQHQELLITDIKYILGNNPLLPKYNDTFTEHTAENHNREWLSVNEGLYNIGHNSKDFCYDNELGRHQVFINAFQVSNKLVTMEVHDVNDADVLGNNPIYSNGSVVGRATGGDFGFRLNKSLALGMVKPDLANIGQDLEIDILGKIHKVSIIEDSPYDPENKLLRA